MNLVSKQLVWRLLIVEDNQADIESIQDNLEKTRDIDGPTFEFGLAGSLGDCIALLASETFDLVLLDLHLPDTTGDLEGLRIIRQANPSIPIIILTSLDPSWEFIGRAASNGAQEFVNKDELHLRPLARIVGFALDRWHLSVLKLQKQAFEATQLLAKMAQEKAEEESRRKTEFLALMSHEIRTPLSAVLGFAELLAADKDLKGEMLFAAEAFRRNGLALTRLLDDILDLSKVESGHLTVERLDFPLSEFVFDIIETKRAMAVNKGLSFDFVANSVVPERLVTDPFRLRQILTNIIGNAIKFTSVGFVKIEIDFLKPSRLEFHVSDSGPGLSLEQQKKLFSSFTQGDSSTSRKFGGSGIGLELSRRLARALGGDVTITKSTPGEGSTFMVAIDTGLVGSEMVLARLSPWLRPIIGEPTYLSPPVLPLLGTNILVVDDSTDNLILFRRLLERAGSTVTVARDGQEGVKRTLEDKPDLVFMDMCMPVMNGYEATVKLRKKGFYGPIVALTANAMAEERALYLEAGCDDCLIKPVDHRLLVVRARHFISASHAQSATIKNAYSVDDLL